MSFNYSNKAVRGSLAPTPDTKAKHEVVGENYGPEQCQNRTESNIETQASTAGAKDKTLRDPDHNSEQQEVAVMSEKASKPSPMLMEWMSDVQSHELRALRLQGIGPSSSI